MGLKVNAEGLYVNDDGTPYTSYENTNAAPWTGEENTSALGDFWTGVKSSALSTGQAALGAIDLVTNGRAGASQSSAGKWLDEAQANLQSEYRPKTQMAMQRRARAVQDAEGEFAKGAAWLSETITNPSLWPGFAGEMSTTTVGGAMPGVLARAAVKGSVKKAVSKEVVDKYAGKMRDRVNGPLPAAANEANKAYADQVGQFVADRVGAKVGARGAVLGEGAMGAGMSANQIVNENVREGRDPSEGLQSAWGVGGLTSAVAGGAGRFYGGLEQAWAGGRAGLRQMYTATGKPQTFLKSIAGEATEEGLQAVGETVIPNVARDKQWNEGLGENLAASALGGGMMGGGMHAVGKPLSYFGGRQPMPNAMQQQQNQQVVQDVGGDQADAMRSAAEQGSRLEQYRQQQQENERKKLQDAYSAKLDDEGKPIGYVDQNGQQVLLSEESPNMPNGAVPVFGKKGMSGELAVKNAKQYFPNDVQDLMESKFSKSGRSAFTPQAASQYIKLVSGNKNADLISQAINAEMKKTGKAMSLDDINELLHQTTREGSDPQKGFGIFYSKLKDADSAEVTKGAAAALGLDTSKFPAFVGKPKRGDKSAKTETPKKPRLAETEEGKTFLNANRNHPNIALSNESLARFNEAADRAGVETATKITQALVDSMKPAGYKGGKGDKTAEKFISKIRNIAIVPVDGVVNLDTILSNLKEERDNMNARAAAFKYEFNGRGEEYLLKIGVLDNAINVLSSQKAQSETTSAPTTTTENVQKNVTANVDEASNNAVGAANAAKVEANAQKQFETMQNAEARRNAPATAPVEGGINLAEAIAKGHEAQKPAEKPAEKPSKPKAAKGKRATATKPTSGKSSKPAPKKKTAAERAKDNEPIGPTDLGTKEYTTWFGAPRSQFHADYAEAFEKTQKPNKLMEFEKAIQESLRKARIEGKDYATGKDGKAFPIAMSPLMSAIVNELTNADEYGPLYKPYIPKFVLSQYNEDFVDRVIRPLVKRQKDMRQDAREYSRRKHGLARAAGYEQATSLNKNAGLTEDLEDATALTYEPVNKAREALANAAEYDSASQEMKDALELVDAVDDALTAHREGMFVTAGVAGQGRNGKITTGPSGHGGYDFTEGYGSGNGGYKAVMKMLQKDVNPQWEDAMKQLHNYAPYRLSTAPRLLDLFMGEPVTAFNNVGIRHIDAKVKEALSKKDGRIRTAANNAVMEARGKITNEAEREKAIQKEIDRAGALYRRLSAAVQDINARGIDAVLDDVERNKTTKSEVASNPILSRVIEDAKKGKTLDLKYVLSFLAKDKTATEVAMIFEEAKLEEEKFIEDKAKYILEDSFVRKEFSKLVKKYPEELRKAVERLVVRIPVFYTQKYMKRSFPFKNDNFSAAETMILSMLDMDKDTAIAAFDMGAVRGLRSDPLVEKKIKEGVERTIARVANKYKLSKEAINELVKSKSAADIVNFANDYTKAVQDGNVETLKTLGLSEASAKDLFAAKTVFDHRDVTSLQNARVNWNKTKIERKPSEAKNRKGAVPLNAGSRAYGKAGVFSDEITEETINDTLAELDKKYDFPSADIEEVKGYIEYSGKGSKAGKIVDFAKRYKMAKSDLAKLQSCASTYRRSINNKKLRMTGEDRDSGNDKSSKYYVFAPFLDKEWLFVNKLSVAMDDIYDNYEEVEGDSEQGKAIRRAIDFDAAVANRQAEIQYASLAYSDAKGNSELSDADAGSMASASVAIDYVMSKAEQIRNAQQIYGAGTGMYYALTQDLDTLTTDAIQRIERAYYPGNINERIKQKRNDLRLVINTEKASRITAGIASLGNNPTDQQIADVVADAEAFYEGRLAEANLSKNPVGDASSGSTAAGLAREKEIREKADLAQEKNTVLNWYKCQNKLTQEEYTKRFNNPTKYKSGVKSPNYVQDAFEMLTEGKDNRPRGTQVADRYMDSMFKYKSYAPVTFIARAKVEKALNTYAEDTSKPWNGNNTIMDIDDQIREQSSDAIDSIKRSVIALIEDEVQFMKVVEGRQFIKDFKQQMLDTLKIFSANSYGGVNGDLHLQSALAQGVIKGCDNADRRMQKLMSSNAESIIVPPNNPGGGGVQLPKARLRKAPQKSAEPKESQSLFTSLENHQPISEIDIPNIRARNPQGKAVEEKTVFVRTKEPGKKVYSGPAMHIQDMVKLVNECASEKEFLWKTSGIFSAEMAKEYYSAIKLGAPVFANADYMIGEQQNLESTDPKFHPNPATSGIHFNKVELEVKGIAGSTETSTKSTNAVFTMHTSIAKGLHVLHEGIHDIDDTGNNVLSKSFFDEAMNIKGFESDLDTLSKGAVDFTEKKSTTQAAKVEGIYDKLASKFGTEATEVAFNALCYPKVIIDGAGKAKKFTIVPTRADEMYASYLSAYMTSPAFRGLIDIVSPELGELIKGEIDGTLVDLASKVEELNGSDAVLSDANGTAAETVQPDGRGDVAGVGAVRERDGNLDAGKELSNTSAVSGEGDGTRNESTGGANRQDNRTEQRGDDRTQPVHVGRGSENTRAQNNDVVNAQESGTGSNGAGAGSPQSPRLRKITQAVRDAIDNYAPEWLRNFADTVLNALFKVRLGLSFTEGIINYVDKRFGTNALPSMRKFYNSVVAMRAEMEQRMQVRNRIGKAAVDLRKNGELKPVNALLHDASLEGIWFYKEPTVFKTEEEWKKYCEELSDADKAKQAELASRFTSMSRNARGVVMSVFRSGVEDWNASLETMLANGVKPEDFLDQISRRPEPYVPFGRFGQYFVVTKSKDYEEMERATNAKAQEVERARRENPDLVDSLEGELKSLRNELAKMRRDRDAGHYGVSSFDSLAQARAAAKKMHGRLYERQEVVQNLAPTWAGLENIKSAVEADIGLQGDPQADKLKKALTDTLSMVYLQKLCANTARTNKLHREAIGGESGETLVNWMQAGRSTDAMFATMHHMKDINKNMYAMTQEVRGLSDKEDTLEASQIVNELLKRYELDVSGAKNSGLTNAALRSASGFLLVASPGFYFQNLMQPYMMTAPTLAGYFGNKAYGEISKCMKEVGSWVLKDPDLENIEKYVTDKDEMDAIKQANEHGRFDYGISSDFGELDSMETVGSKFKEFLGKSRTAVQATEKTIRIASFLAAYRLAKKSEKYSKEATARDLAESVVYETHGDYSKTNAPRYFRQAPLLAQFRKFQLIQMGWIVRMTEKAFDGATDEEKALARRQLAWSMGTYFTMAGAIGTPLASTMLAATALMFGGSGDDDEDMIRKMVGDKTLADLLVGGVPKALGIDISRKVGATNVFDPAPFLEVRNRSGYGLAGDAALTLAGPFASTVLQRIEKSYAHMTQGDIVKGMADWLPNGIPSNAFKTASMALNGVTDNQGMVLMDGKVLGVQDYVSQLFGFPTNKLTDMQRIRTSTKNHDTALSNELRKLRRDYTKARMDRDSEEIRDIIKEFQQVRREFRSIGYDVQDFTKEIVSSYESMKKREKNVSAGVPYTKRNAGYVKRQTQYGQ